MLEKGLELIKYIDTFGYDAYIVGGFVRDHILGIESNDVDICTNATPKDIRDIFNEACLPNDDYGSVRVIYKGVRFEITTFRKEYTYVNNRRPSEVKYINNLEEDLKRRDFTINTICMDKDGKIIDLFNGVNDINKRKIKTVSNAYDKFTEDSLRILRAVRFATKLGFKLSDEVIIAIKETKHLLKDLSYTRKKEELEKIFTSPNVRDGVSLITKLGLENELEIQKIKRVPLFDDVLGVWAYLNVQDIYPFTNNEKDQINDIRACFKLINTDPFPLYTYGLYPNLVAGHMKGISRKEITKNYDELPIHSRKDIAIHNMDIAKLLNKQPGPYLKEIVIDLESKIVNSELNNDNNVIVDYILKNYN